MIRSRNQFVSLLIVFSFSFSFFLISNASANNEKATGERLQGYALKQPVSVYANPSRDATVLKNYNYNHHLVYRPYSSEWFVVTVYINGISYRGYIHKSDVGNHDQAQSVRGVALQKTNVFSSANRSSKVLKSYNKGSILQYRSYNKDWYAATVYVSGVKHTGYISAKNVETIDTQQLVMKGIGIKKPTPVYSLASKDSNILKSYKSGQILQYRTFSKNWFEATVYVNGKARKGYISTTDVEPITKKQQTLTGVGIKQPTRVYSLASKDSKALKDYKYGQILKFRPFSNNWYEATVYVNGKPRTGYIFKNDVNNDVNGVLKGYALGNSTAVYSGTSRKSAILKRYKKGQPLQFRAYDSNWFRATVYVDGKAKTGFIHTSDVSPNAPKLKAYALANPTYIYSKTSRSSPKLKSYTKGTLLQFRPYNDFWHEATVYVQGKAQTGYIHVNDVGDLPVKKEPGLDIPILMYHQIDDNPIPEEFGLFVKADNFEKQMNYLKTAGFTPINFDEIPNIKKIKNPIIITFDDGYENNRIAYEILKKINDKSFKPKATFFIIGAKIDVKNYLSAAQIKEMSDSGIISVQSHTMTHPFFNDNETANRIIYTEQLHDSKKKLEQLTGKKVSALAYPYGSYNDVVIAETKKYYDYAVTTKSGIANTSDSPYELKRVRVRFDTTLEQFKKSIGR